MIQTQYNRIFLLIVLFLTTVPSLQGETINILFIGNSFTHSAGGVNRYIEAMLETNSGFSDVNAVSTAMSGWYLDQHAANTSSSYAQLTSGTAWDYIVLQEYSTGTSTATLESRMIPGGTSLYNTILSNSPTAQVFLYETWARPASGTIIDLPTVQAGYQTLQTTLNSLADSYNAAAGSGIAKNVQIVKAGTAWADVLNTAGLNLYAADNYHQNALGNYTTALQFYKSITGDTNVQDMYSLLGASAVVTTNNASIVSTVSSDQAAKIQLRADGLDIPGQLLSASYQGSYVNATWTTSEVYKNGKYVADSNKATFTGESTVSNESLTVTGDGTVLTLTGNLNMSNGGVVNISNGAIITSAMTGFNFHRIGQNGTGTMNVLSGGQFDVHNCIIVGRNGAAEGFLNVDGTGSVVKTTDVLYVGGWNDSSSNASGTISITNGGQVDASVVAIGRTSGATGTITVNNASLTTTINTEAKSGSSVQNHIHWENGTAPKSGDLWLGVTGKGTLDVQDNGQLVVSGALLTARDASAANSAITMSGTGTILVAGTTTIGSAAKTTVTMTDSSAFLNRTETTIARGSTVSLAATNNVFLVASGSAVPCTQGVYVGYGSAGNGTLNLNDSTISSTNIYMGNNSSQGTINATGTALLDSTNLYLGHTGTSSAPSAGTLNVNSGVLTVTAASLNLGETANSTGTITIAEGAKLLYSGAWNRVGATGGTGTVNVYGAYEASLSGFGGMALGRYANSIGSLLVSGANAQFLSKTTDFSLSVGGYEGGTVSTNALGIARVEKGALMALKFLGIAEFATARGEMTVDNSALIVSGTARVGNRGTGVLHIDNGANATFSSGITLGNNSGSVGTLSIGQQATETTQAVAGGTVTNAGNANIGLNGTGNLVITNGSFLQTGGEFNTANGSTDSQSVVTINEGGLLKITSGIYARFGRTGAGELNINAEGAYENSAHTIIGRNVKGVLNVNGGDFISPNGTLFLAGWDDNVAAKSFLNLSNGGSITASGMNLAVAKSTAATVVLGSPDLSGERSTVSLLGGTQTAELNNGSWAVYSNLGWIIGAEGNATVDIYNADVSVSKSVEIGHVRQGGDNTGTGAVTLHSSAHLTVGGDFLLGANNLASSLTLHAGANVTVKGNLTAGTQGSIEFMANGFGAGTLTVEGTTAEVQGAAASAALDGPVANLTASRFLVYSGPEITLTAPQSQIWTLITTVPTVPTAAPAPSAAAASDLTAAPALEAASVSVTGTQIYLSLNPAYQLPDNYVMNSSPITILTQRQTTGWISLENETTDPYLLKLSVEGVTETNESQFVAWLTSGLGAEGEIIKTDGTWQALIPSESDLSNLYLAWDFANPTDSSLAGISLRSISGQSVPEPATGFLLLTGLWLIFGFRRFGKRGA